MRALEILPTKGLNNGDKSVRLEDGLSPDCLNVRFYQNSVKKRDGLVLHITGQAQNDEVTGLFQFKTDAQAISQICFCGNDAYRENVASWTSVKGAVTLTSNETALFSAGVLNDLLVATNGVDQILKWAGATNNLAALGGSPPDKAGALTSYKNFIILIDTTEGGVRYPARARWSDLNNSESWPAGNFSPLVLSGGQVAKGFGKIRDQLYIFLDESIYAMAYTGSSTTPFTFMVVAPSVGAVSRQSVVSVDTAVFFLGSRGPYLFQGSDPVYIGASIEGTWKTVNQSRLQYAIGCHNAKYNEVWWSFSTAAGITYDTTLVYNYVKQTWSIFQFGVIPTCYGQFLETLPTTPVMGVSNGYVYKTNHATAVDGTVAISAYCVTKPLDFGNPTEIKRVRELQLVLEASATAGATVTILTGYDIVTPAGINTLQVMAGGDTWNVGTWGAAVWAAINTLLLWCRPYGRGRYFQARVQNNEVNQGFDISSLVAYVDGEIQQG